MLRELFHNFVALLVALALLVFAAVLSPLGPGWLKLQLQGLLAQELANRTGREVQLGALSGDLLTGLEARDVAIAGPGGLQSSVILAAPFAQVSYNLLPVLRGQLGVAAALDTVELKQAYVDLVRDRTGHINLVELFRARVPTVVPPEQRFRGRIVFRQSRVFYTDQTSLGRRGQGLYLGLREMDMTLDLGRLQWVAAQGAARVTTGQLQSFSVKAVVGPQGASWVTAEVAGVNVPWLYQYLWAAPQVEPLAGMASGQVGYWSFPDATGQRRVGYYALTDLRGAQAKLRPLGSEPVAFDGRMQVTPEGVTSTGLTASWAGTRLSGSGTLFDYAKPTLDLEFSGSSGNLQRLVNLLPVSARGSLVKLRGLQQAQLSGSAVGQWTHASLELKMSAPEELTVADPKVGEVTLSGLDLQAQVLDWGSPAIAARVASRRARVPHVAPSVLGVPWPQRVSVTDMQGLKADLVWAKGQPLVSSTLTVDRIQADKLVVQNLRAPVQIAGGTIVIPQVRASVMGGEIRAGAMASFGGKQAGRAYMTGEVQQVDLTCAGQLPYADASFEGWGGKLSGTFAFAMKGDVVTGGARVHVAAPRWKEVQLAEVNVLIESSAQGLQVPLLEVADGKGMLWARGKISSREDLDLRVAGAELDGGKIARLFGVQDAAGTGYLAGTIGGTTSEPSADVKLYLFGPRYQEYAASALTAHVAGDQRKLEVSDLLLARGESMLAGDFRLDEPYWWTDGETPLTGHLQALGLNVRDALELAGSKLDATGAGNLEASLSGTLRHPQADGKLELAWGSIKRFGVSSASVPFVLTPDELVIQEAEFRAQDAVVTADARVTNLRGRPEYVAHLQATNLVLQDQAPLRERGLDLEGEVSISQAEVHSTPEGPVGSGTLTAQQVKLGGQQIEDINASFALQRGRLELNRTEFALGGGRVSSAGFYDWGTGEMRLEAGVQNARVEQLLRMAAPVASAFEPEPDAEHPPKNLPLSQTLTGLAYRLKGTLTGTTLLSGPLKEPSGNVQLQFAEGSYDNKSLPAAQAKFELDMVQQTMRGLQVELTEGESAAYLSGDVQFHKQVNLVLDPCRVDLALLSDWLPRGLTLGGSAQVTAVVRGDPAAPEVTCSVDVQNANLAGASFDLLSVPLLTIKQGRANFDTLILRRGDQEIVADGYLPFSWRSPYIPRDQQMRFATHIRDTSLGFFPPIVDEVMREQQRKRHETVQPTVWAKLVASGTVNSDLTVGGTPADPIFDGSFRLAQGSLKLPGWSQPVEDIEVDAALTGLAGGELGVGAELETPAEQAVERNQLQIKRAFARWDHVTAQLTGSSRLDYFNLDDLPKNSYDLALAIKAPEETLRPGLTLHDLDGTAKLTTTEEKRQRLTFEGWSGKLNGGEIALRGVSFLDSFRPREFAANETNLSLSLAPTSVSYPGLLKRGTVSLELALANPGPGRPVKLTARGELAQALVSAALPAPSQRSLLRGMGVGVPAFDLDVRMALGRGVVFSGRGFRAPLQAADGALLIAGTPQRPEISGTVQVVPGQATVPAGALDVKQLGVEYSLSPKPGDNSVPVVLQLGGRVWGQAEKTFTGLTVNGRDVGPVHVVMELSGELPDHVRIDTRSEPPLSQDQILALVGLGTLGQTGLMGDNSTLTQLVSEQWLSLLASGFQQAIFESVEEQIKRMFGLSDFNVVFSFDQATELRLGKYLAKNLLVTYRRSVGGVVKWDLGLSYEIPGNLRVTYAANERGETQLRVGRSLAF